MTVRPATVAQVRAIADEVRAKLPDARVMLVRAAPKWTEDNEIALRAGTARVVAADSPLAVREAITRDVAEDRLLVVLTDATDRELGADVLARVATHKVRALQPWPMVRARMGLSGLDPQLGNEAWMADALINYEPPERWQPPMSGFLTADHAWQQLSQRWLGLEPTGDLTGLVSWLAGGIERLRTAPEAVRQGAVSRLVRSYPSPATAIIEVALKGLSAEVVPLGLAARAVFAPAAGSDLVEARVRFALEIGQRSLDEVAARAWASAAEQVVVNALPGDGRIAVEPWLMRAEHYLAHFGAQQWAVESPVLPSGLEQRYQRSATALQRVINGDSGSVVSIENAVVSVVEHALAPSDSVRVDRLQAAARLARRLTHSVPRPDTFPAAADLHRLDSSWADRARVAVRHGDNLNELGQAYTELLKAVDADRELENERFAKLLQQWSVGEPGEATSILPIERVLARVVAPLAARCPVLLVVLDGMSWSVGTELLATIEPQGWVSAQPSGGSMPIGVATLPTVTRVSRSSLLCGTRVTGEAPIEPPGFASAPAFRGLGGSDPTLFHKNALSTADGNSLGTPLRTALADESVKVVGVVINAIDDHLSRGDQSRVPWTIDSVQPLRHLMDEAAAAGRIVVMTSDHGHVFEERGRTVYRQVPDATERWRPNTVPAQADEVVIRGPRVLAGDGEVVMPWTEALRYGTHKHGYHGGATPQEVLVPIWVLARAAAIPDGWERTSEEAPTWWRGTPAPSVESAVPIAPSSPVVHRARTAPTGQAELFDDTPPAAPAEATSPTGWVGSLLSAPTYAARRSAVSRAQLDDDLVSQVLASLDRRGGTALKETLAADIGRPLFRIDGLVQSMRRLLNIEGYAAVDVQGDTVVLHRDVLLMQFEVST